MCSFDQCLKTRFWRCNKRCLDVNSSNNYRLLVHTKCVHFLRCGVFTFPNTKHLGGKHAWNFPMFALQNNPLLFDTLRPAHLHWHRSHQFALHFFNKLCHNLGPPEMIWDTQRRMSRWYCALPTGDVKTKKPLCSWQSWPHFRWSYSAEWNWKTKQVIWDKWSQLHLEIWRTRLQSHWILQIANLPEWHCKRMTVCDVEKRAKFSLLTFIPLDMGHWSKIQKQKTSLSSHWYSTGVDSQITKPIGSPLSQPDKNREPWSGSRSCFLCRQTGPRFVLHKMFSCYNCWTKRGPKMEMWADRDGHHRFVLHWCGGVL